MAPLDRFAALSDQSDPSTLDPDRDPDPGPNQLAEPKPPSAPEEKKKLDCTGSWTWEIGGMLVL